MTILSPSAPATSLPKLPACSYCFQKKIKCDNGRPSCVHCIRNGVQCENYNSVRGELIPRTRIHELEQRQREPNLGHRPLSTDASYISPASVPTTGGYDAPTVPSIASSSAVMNRGGLSFLALLFSDADWRKSNADLLRGLGDATRPPEVPIQPCSLPSLHVAEELFGKYLGWSHVQSAFLLRREVWELHSRVFSGTERDTFAGSDDMFRTFMICAIGSVLPFRNGNHPQHPEGYYLAAQRHINSRFLARGLRSVEDLLLICRFGIYHNIGTSIWDLIRLAGRLCIELELHAHDGGPLLAPIERQRRRRIFWHFYTIDRYSSTTLDRPFTIDDCDIHIGLPANVDDKEIESWSRTSHPQLLDLPPEPQELAGLTETTILLISVKLRRVSSDIHTEFCRLREDFQVQSHLHLGIGRIHIVVNQLLGQLEIWRQNTPAIQNPTCLYHSQQWYDLLYAREKLYLVRRAVDLVPRKGGVLPKNFLTLLLHSALDVIEKYSSLCWTTSLITHTRSYFHMMFTAGLSVIFCVLYTSELLRDDLESSSRGLGSCERTLASMAPPLQHAEAYVTVFAALHRDVSRKIKRALGCGGPSPPSEETPLPRINTTGTPAPELPISTRHYTSSLRSRGTDLSAAQTGYSSMATTLGVNNAETYSQEFHHHRDSNPSAGPYAPDFSAVISPHGPHSDPTDNHGDLLQWTFTEDTSLWNMDTMLWEYVNGDPEAAAFTDNAPLGL